MGITMKKKQCPTMGSAMTISNDYQQWLSAMTISNDYQQWLSAMTISNDYQQWLRGIIEFAWEMARQTIGVNCAIATGGNQRWVQINCAHVQQSAQLGWSGDWWIVLYNVVIASLLLSWTSFNGTLNFSETNILNLNHVPILPQIYNQTSHTTVMCWNGVHCRLPLICNKLVIAYCSLGCACCLSNNTFIARNQKPVVRYNPSHIYTIVIKWDTIQTHCYTNAKQNKVE